ncbi:MAG: hypothetical protein IKL65_05665 [Bacilli bacterium]|nr:hypothetical protein [Bacilli bacterium]
MKLYKEESQKNEIICMPETARERIEDAKSEIRATIQTLGILGVGVVISASNLGFFIRNDFATNSIVFHSVALLGISGATLGFLISLRNQLKEKRMLEEHIQMIDEVDEMLKRR